MGVEASFAEGELTQLIEDGNPADAMRTRHAFDAVRRQMFGRPSRPPLLGRYMLIEHIGQGGIGLVYSAYDPKLHRQVAIKLLRPTRLSSVHVKVPAEELLREAQALASVSHPNVVSVYDVGTARADSFPTSAPECDSPDGDELFFIVMELVDGPTLHEWLAERPRSWRTILRVFEECARGLAAAHGVGLVHRDFKPGNVIVGRGDHPRVLDFGLARLARAPDLPLADDADATPSEPSDLARERITSAAFAVGTPPYMSPEQHRGAEVDARSDQFAFCASLWEALFGERPFPRGPIAAVFEAKLAGPPSRPPGRKIPAWVYRVLARGLRPASIERFVDMAALSSALRRDRLRRSLRVAAGGAIVAVIGGLVALNVEDRRREREACLGEPQLAFHEGARDRIRAAFVATGLPDAESVAAAATDRIDGFVDEWRKERRTLCDLDRAARQGDDVVLRTVCLDRQAEAVEFLVAQLEIADAVTVHRAVELADRTVSPADCATPGDVLPSDLFRTLEGRRTPEALRLDREIQRSIVLFDLGKRHEALEVAQRALQDAEVAGLPFLEARAQAQICKHIRGFGYHDRVEPECFRALELAERVGSDALAIGVFSDLVRELVREGNLVGAEMAQRAAEGKLGRTDLPPTRQSNVIRSRGVLEEARGDHRAALEAYERALELVVDAPEFPDQAAVRTQIAHVALALGDIDRAIAEHERILAVTDAHIGPLHPERGLVLNNLGRALTRRGDWAAAHARLTEALAIKEHTYGRSSTTLLTTLTNLGDLALSRGDFAAATAAVNHAASICETAGEPLQDGVAFVRIQILLRTGDPRRAAGEARDLLERFLGHGGTPEEIAGARRLWGEALLLADDTVAAAAMLEEALAGYEQAFGTRHVLVATTLAELGRAEVGMGRLAAGLVRIEHAVEILAHVQGEPLSHARVRFTLARVLPAERRTDALAHARAAADIYRRLGGPPDETLAVESWLSEHGRGDP